MSLRTPIDADGFYCFGCLEDTGIAAFAWTEGLPMDWTETDPPAPLCESCAWLERVRREP